ncbi:MAG: hypothetical protein O2907_02790 [Proteobacteria bacterium]|nr:hypothetical protein [Pseudomonadota bacterium]MDA1063260.1 hypothetical protein [Pseudomonadota bacterium]
MTLPYDKSAAVVVLPSLAGDRVSDPGLRCWLSRGTVSRSERPRELLRNVLESLQLPYPEEGIAALRMWGQTGDRPTVWVAAADPVYLEARLTSLCLHALQGAQMPSRDLHEILDYLQQRLAGEDRYGFARIGLYGYVRASTPLPTSRYPASVIDQQAPNDYLPVADETSRRHALRGEVEMALHEHAVNQRRELEGQLPVNSLWLWGGGFAPAQTAEPRPPLFADDALLRGYWLSKTGTVDDWSGSIDACLDAAIAGFVAVPVDARSAPGELQTCLEQLRAALQSGRISKVTLLLEDGFVVEIRRSDAWRFWHRDTEIFGPQP